MSLLSKLPTPICVAAIFVSNSLFSQVLPVFSGMDREFDNRTAFNRNYSPEINPDTQLARQQLLQQLEGASYSVDAATGVLRTLSRHSNYLTPANKLQTPLDIALTYVRRHLPALGLSSSDFENHVISDHVFTQVTGAQHYYLNQTLYGISVYNAQLQLHINRDGRLISVNNTFMPNAEASANSATPSLTAIEAVQVFADDLGLTLNQAEAAVISTDSDNSGDTRLSVPLLSDDPINSRLQWLPIRAGQLRLVWNIQVLLKHGQNQFDVNIDAADGQLWTRSDWVSEATYRGFSQPTESPNHSANPPPGDGRVLITDPEDSAASPLGWHDDGNTAFTVTVGNNVNAFDDQTGNTTECGPGLICDFDSPIDFASQDPREFVNATVANVFYWTNLIHDIQYQYGFDEQAGNFQTNNFANGGLGNDEITARSQSLDGAFLCPNNASFGSPPDGTSGRLTMCLFTTSPRIASSFDSAVIVHEYGHGISNRLIGGPSAASCLSGRQRAGEGYSDWWGLAYTALPEHTGATGRGLGTYLIGQPPNGPGIRPQPYSTDPAVNSYTYETIRSGVSIPHGVGSVWAQAAWEVYWALVDKHGFDPDLHNSLGGSGNQRAMLYVNEGMKLVPCGPTFTDMRDGMIQAAIDNFGGGDVCTMWQAFAAFGLGIDADPANSNSLNVTNGFALPMECGEAFFNNGFELEDQ